MGSSAVTTGRIGDPDNGFDALIANPEGEGPWPGVVVIHDVFGMTDDLRGQCAWLAGAGFMAVAPNLYHRGNKVACVRQAFKDMRARTGPTFNDIEATRSWLADQPSCTGRIGVIGYCMGGGFSLLLAPGHGFDASSVNYGEVPDDADSLLAGACPVVGSYGGRDRSLKGAAVKLHAAW
ncbi:MAG: dienelactone hydrolase family protein [Microthrixaceae bacterium]|nr:dienelactone hydrolase family protein [Microthrixaceae bacterium]